MVRVVDGKLYFTPYGEEEYYVGNIADGNIEGEYFSLGNINLPIERFAELQNAYNSLYPNGKPIEIVEVKKVITEDEMYKDMVDQLFSSYLASF